MTQVQGRTGHGRPRTFPPRQAPAPRAEAWLRTGGPGMPQGHPGLAENRLPGRLIQAQFVGEKPQVLGIRRWLLPQVLAPQLTGEVAAPHAARRPERLDHLAARLVEVP